MLLYRLDAREQLRLGSVRERGVISIIDIQLEAESTQATTIACGKPWFGITSLVRTKTCRTLKLEALPIMQRVQLLI